nr:type IVB secretion system protein IcmH/DotU [uncultured Desulfobacter sp.]
MSGSDPFDFVDNDKTIVRPRPAGRQIPQPSREASPPSDIQEKDIRAVYLEKSNIFIANSFALLSLIPKIRNLPIYNNIDGLYQNLLNEIKQFEHRCYEQSVTEEDVRVSKLFLCALLDEAVLNTPWGNQSDWKYDNLSAFFFRHINMGNVFFDELEKLKRRPSRTLELLKLAYVCLSLGFQGKYRTINQGSRRLEEEREELHRLIQQTEGDPDRNLSVHWHGRPISNPLIRYVPLWVVAAVAGLFLLVSFSIFLFTISKASDTVYDRIVAIGAETLTPIPDKKEIKPVKIPEPAKFLPEQKPAFDESDRFRKLLSLEIAENKVSVLDGPVIRIPNAFLSGKDEIKKALYPIFIKLAHELKDDTSRIDVLGHSDNQRIRFSIRFPDNHKLSEARAQQAAKIMRNAQPSLADRLTSKGMGYAEPIVPNDSKENRAINRRIDIHIR